MPFKSKAQQRFMFAAESRGDVPKGTARRWAHHTKSIKSLPEHAKKKKKHEKRGVLSSIPALNKQVGVPFGKAKKVKEKRGEAILRKYAGLLCNLPTSKGDIVTAQLLYRDTNVKYANKRLVNLFAALPTDKQMKLAAYVVTSKHGSFVKQAAEVTLWKHQIDKLPNMSKTEKQAFWSGFIKTAWLPLAVGAAKWIGANVGLPMLANWGFEKLFGGGDQQQQQQPQMMMPPQYGYGYGYGQQQAPQQPSWMAAPNTSVGQSYGGQGVS